METIFRICCCTCKIESPITYISRLINQSSNNDKPQNVIYPLDKPSIEINPIEAFENKNNLIYNDDNDEPYILYTKETLHDNQEINYVNKNINEMIINGKKIIIIDDFMA